MVGERTASVECDEHQRRLGVGYWDTIAQTTQAILKKDGVFGLHSRLKEWKAVFRGKKCPHCKLEILIRIRYLEYLILREQARYLE